MLRGRSPSVARNGLAEAARTLGAAKREVPRRALRGALVDVPRLLALGVALQGSMLTYGLLQELLTSSRAREASLLMLPPALFVCINRIGCAAIAWLVLRCARARDRGVGGGSALPRKATEESALWRKALISAVAATTDGVLRYMALALMPFTSFLVLRGIGVFPNLLFGWILHAAPSGRDIFLACCIALGVLCYGTGAVPGATSGDVGEAYAGGGGVGGGTGGGAGGDAMRLPISLPSLALACTAITAKAFNSQWQASIFRQHTLSALELMYRTSSAAAVISVSLLVASGEALSSLATLRDEPRWVSFIYYRYIFLCESCLTI